VTVPGRLALIDEMRTMPFGAVWDYLCEKDGIPNDRAWMPLVQEYEAKVQTDAPMNPIKCEAL
jgi:L-rhamnose isomerase